jgi:transketolase
MQTPVTFIWTHDSIGLGEDGPTHQPVEHLWSLRAIPGLNIVRPADPQETAAAWLSTLERRQPTGLVLSRQDLPALANSSMQEIREGVNRGAYVVAGDHDFQVIIMATGSEVSLALAARDLLTQSGITSRVVSMPCLEWFEQQSLEYKESVLPVNITSRVAVEAGSTLGWYRYVGMSGEVIGLDHFGASGSAPELYEAFNITPHAIEQACMRTLSRNNTTS